MRDDLLLKLQRIIEGNDKITWELFPAIYDGFLEADELSLAEDRMLRLIASAVLTCANDKLISTAGSDRIEEYEAEFGLSSEGLTLEERRQQVADYINRSRVFNEDKLHALAQSLAPGFTVYERTDPQALTLGIFTEEEDVQGHLPAVAIVPQIAPKVPQNLALYAGADTEFDRPVVISHGHYTALLADIGLVERSQPPMVALGGTIDTDSQTSVMIEVGKMGGIATRSGFSFVDKQLVGLMPLDGGAVDRSGFSFVDRSLVGNMPDDGGTVSRSGFSFVDKQLEGSMGGYEGDEIDIDCNWGDAVTIPAGYTVQSVKTSRAFAKVTSRNLSDSTLTIDVGGEGEYIDDIGVSDFTIKASPCLQVFAYNSSAFSNGYYITCNANQTPSTIPISVDALKLNSDGLFFRLQASYSSAASATNVYSAFSGGLYTVSFRYYDAVTNLVDYAFKAIPDSWSFVNGTFAWTPASATYDRFWLYLNKKPETRIHCVSTEPTPTQGGTISPDPFYTPILAYKQDGTTSPGMTDLSKYQVDAVDSNYYTEEELEALGWYVKWRVYSIPSSSGGINIRDSYGTSGTTVLTYWNNVDHPIVNPFLQGPSGYEDWWQMKFTLNGGSVQTGWSRFGIEGLGVTYEEKTVTTDVVNLYH